MMFRPSIQEDFKAFMDFIPRSARSWTAVEEGIVYGVGGVYYDNGQTIAFTHYREDMPKRDRVRSGPYVLSIIRSIDGPVYAFPGNHTTAQVTLRHFGFEPVLGADHWIWRGK